MAAPWRTACCRCSACSSRAARTQCIKLGCSMIGWKLGQPRPPLRPPTHDQEALLRAMLDMLVPFESEDVVA